IRVTQGAHSFDVAPGPTCGACNQTGCIRAYDSVLRRLVSGDDRIFFLPTETFADLRLLVHRVHIKNSRFGILFDKGLPRSATIQTAIIAQQSVAAGGSLTNLGILRRMRPTFKCSNTTGLFWPDGKEIFRTPPIGTPVGRWAMSSQHESLGGTSFDMQGVTLARPGQQAPLRPAEEIRLRAATLKEDPFLQLVSWETSRRACPTLPAAAPSGHRSASRADERSELRGGSVFEVPDKKWGGWTNNEWNGLVRVLLEGQADMVVTSLKITPNRSEQIEFSVPFHRTGITILVALREGPFLLRPFSSRTTIPSWCLILVFSVHACGAALFLFEWLSPQGLDKGNVPQGAQVQPSVLLWLIWSMLFGARGNLSGPYSPWCSWPRTRPTLRLLMIAEESYYDLSGINDWRLRDPTSHRPPFRFATVPSGATEENMRMNYPDIAKHMRNYSKSNIDEGIRTLKTFEIDAFIYDATVLQYRVGNDEDCKLKTWGNWYSMTGYGIGLPKGSKWRHRINHRILSYRSSGCGCLRLLERWSKYWITGACQQSGKLRNTNQTLGVKNFISAFILLIGGMLFCCLLLLLEHCFYRRLRPQLKKWDRYGCCGLVS
uniref:PBPe domain-containing protein n=1 Tax=Macrostomum lignano TaxID=282301 RepID=A0A1I8FP28_9PLAT